MQSGPDESRTAATAEPPPFKMGAVARHSVIYAVGTLLGKSISFVMLPVYTRYLTPADYGIIALIEMTLDVICVVAGAQMVLGVLRFYHKTEIPRERQAVISTALMGVAAAHIAVGLFTFLGAEPLSRLVLGTPVHADLIRLAAVAMAFASLSLVPLSFARLQDRSGLFVAATLAKLLIALSLNILFVVEFRWGVRGVFLSTLIANAVVGIGLMTWSVREVGLTFSRSAVRDLLRFGLPLVAVNFATFFVMFGGRYFLQRSADETVVGLYSLGFQLGFILAMAHSPFDMVWDPKRFEIAKRVDRDELLSRGFVYKNLIMLPVAGIIALFVNDVLLVMATTAFHAAANVVPIVLIAFVFQGWGSQDIGILMRERTKLLWAIHWITAVVALACFLTLIPRYHAMGAAASVAVAFGVRWGMIYATSQRLWPVRYDWRPVNVLIVATGSLVLLGALLHGLLPGWSFAARAALLAGYFILLWRSDVLSPLEKDGVRSAVSLVAHHAFARRGDAVAHGPG